LHGTVTLSHHQDGKAGADGAGAIKVKPSSVDAFRSFRISQDDPCHKVLPAALKKYKINDDWQKYALFICYGTTGKCGDRIAACYHPLLFCFATKMGEYC
jgi:hypothetical protein